MYSHCCLPLQVQSKGVFDGVLQCRKPEKTFPMLCSLGRPLFKQLESGRGRSQNQQGKKEKVALFTEVSLALHLSLSLSAG